MPQVLKDKEQLIAQILRNVKTAAEVFAEVEEEAVRQQTVEVERDIVRWVAVGQAATSRLLALMREKKPDMELKHEGELLSKMGIPHEKLQWSAEDEAFY